MIQMFGLKLPCLVPYAATSTAPFDVACKMMLQICKCQSNKENLQQTSQKMIHVLYSVEQVLPKMLHHCLPALDDAECGMLAQGMQNVANMAKPAVTVQTIQNKTSLDKDKAQLVKTFFTVK